jgi:hypothetical protein
MRRPGWPLPDRSEHGSETDSRGVRSAIAHYTATGTPGAPRPTVHGQPADLGPQPGDLLVALVGRPTLLGGLAPGQEVVAPAGEGGGGDTQFAGDELQVLAAEAAEDGGGLARSREAAALAAIRSAGRCAFADGSVRFIKDSISTRPMNGQNGAGYGPRLGIDLNVTISGGSLDVTSRIPLGVWQKLGTRSGGEIVGADAY